MSTGSDARREQLADDVEALAQRLLGMRPDQLGRQPRGVGGAEDGADRGAGDDLGLQAQLVEHLQHQNMREPARAAAAQRQRDRRPRHGQRRLAHLQGFAGRLHGLCHPGCSAVGVEAKSLARVARAPPDVPATRCRQFRGDWRHRSLTDRRNGSSAASVACGFSSARKWPDFDCGAASRSLHQARQTSSGCRRPAEIVAAPQHERRAGDLAARGQVGLVEPAVDAWRRRGSPRTRRARAPAPAAARDSAPAPRPRTGRGRASSAQLFSVCSR